MFYGYCSYLPVITICGFNFQCPQNDFFDFKSGARWVIVSIWVSSQLWILRYILKLGDKAFAPTKELFLPPYITALLIERSFSMYKASFGLKQDSKQSMKTHNHDIIKENAMANCVDKTVEMKVSASDSLKAFRIKSKPSAQGVTMIYACATMWRETKKEMRGAIKSMFRMYQDQQKYRNTEGYLKKDPAYYDFEGI